MKQITNVGFSGAMVVLCPKCHSNQLRSITVEVKNDYLGCNKCLTVFKITDGFEIPYSQYTFAAGLK